MRVVDLNDNVEGPLVAASRQWGLRSARRRPVNERERAGLWIPELDGGLDQPSLAEVRRCKNALDFLREPLTITHETFSLIESMRLDSNIAAGHLGLDAADTNKPAISSLNQHLAYTAAAMFFVNDETSDASKRPKHMKQRKRV